MVSFAAGRFSGVIAGALAGGGVFLLGRSDLLPDPVMTVALLFCGGFIAGLFTRGRARDGAVAGAVCGVLVALIAATFTSLAARDPSFLSTFAFYALIFTGLLLPYNAIGGAAGRAMRSAPRETMPPGRASGTGGTGSPSARSSSSVWPSYPVSSVCCRSWPLRLPADSSRGMPPGAGQKMV
ncbi:hypothetical protein [Methanoculleus sp. 10]|uniref:hypothetical protein n=1 Tax=Methanoculleus sp. 10 TaxID=430615 RepID=UPI0025FFA203|nr:hypothetical protein [Methanoculleus sp. 10]